MSADLNRLMDNLRIRLPGAVDGVIQTELFAVLDDFFARSNAWTEDIEFDVTAGETDYTITPTGVALINRLMGVVDQNELPVAVTMATPGEIKLVYEPTVAGTYTAQVALTVTDPVTRDGYPIMPDWVMNKYGNDILDGVLGRMMSQIAKPYTNERMAIYHMRRFSGAVSQAKVEAQHRNVYRGQNWRFPQTFARRKAR